MGDTVQIHGGALAGCAAALAARREGASTLVYEKSPFPRHKVCGEFLSHGVETLFRDFGLWGEFLNLNPAVISRLELHFPRKSFHYNLPEPCWGLSRYVLDDWLMRSAIASGASWRQEPASALSPPLVVAYGRRERAPKGDRVFGFKAHHAGPPTDAIELHFFDRGYVGVSPVENDIVNVCGLAFESELSRQAFDYDAICDRSPTLRERRRNLRRIMDWLSVGPLIYRTPPREVIEDGVYPAGDALGFIDPFTGAGMFNALLSGSMAGAAAARGVSVASYLEDCRRLLNRPFLVSALFRKALASGLADRAAGWLPGSLLFRLTRAHLG